MRVEGPIVKTSCMLDILHTESGTKQGIPLDNADGNQEAPDEQRFARLLPKT